MAKDYKHIKLEKHPKNEAGVFKDLSEKFDKFGSLYIGVDFDHTLLPYGKTNLSEEGVAAGFIDIVNLLKRAKSLGLKLCLWTLPTDKENLRWKIQWCKDNGIEMDYINESPLLSELNKDFKKVHFNLLLDDVAGLEASYSILYNLCDYIEEKNK